jgi:hypothetical protein
MEKILDLKGKIFEKYASLKEGYNSNDINTTYAKFKEFYGTNSLLKLSGKDLLYRLFAPKDIYQFSLTYVIEYQIDYDVFGSVRGGSSFKYGMFYSSKKKSWILGSSDKESREILEEEAIEFAEFTRTKIIEMCSVVEKFSPYNDISSYLKLEKHFSSLGGGYFRLWLMKYLHLIYPETFSCFYNNEWRKRVLEFLGINPQVGLFTQNGQIALYAKELGIDNVYFSNTLSHLMPKIEFIDEKLKAIDIPNYIDNSELETNHENSYSKNDFLNEVFFEEIEYQQLVNLLRYKKNVILQGAPGVGKTYLAKRLAFSMIGKKSENQVASIQFHQSYSYEDFILGYKPTENGFELKIGLFYNFCITAKNNPEKEYFFIIDEINRGNLSKIFGELLMLIESDKRGKANSILLAYKDELFYVPNNIFIIGMMNTADRSLALMDYALRRRFSFYDIEPRYGTDRFVNYITSLIGDNDIAKKISNKFHNLNIFISNENNSGLGKGFSIGHSYFCNKPLPGQTIESWYKGIINYEILPLLEEYWWDDKSKFLDIKADLIDY